MSIEVNKEMTVDLSMKQFNVIELVQNDSARTITFNILNAGIPFNLTGLTVRAYASLNYYKDLTIINAAKGICKLNLPTQMINRAGDILLQLRITDSKKIITSFAIKMKIAKSLIDEGSMEGADELSALDVALNKVQQWNAYFEEVAPNLELKYTTELEKKVAKSKNLRIVAKEGGDYNTIMDAVNAGGDTIENPITIMVAPGTYKESVYIKQWSRLNLVGVDKKNCIIKQSHGEYLNAPLETAGERYIANITFIADHLDNPNLDVNLQKTYAFHGDKSGGGDGITLIENCRFESYQNASVGLGIYNNQTFHFKNCEFYSKIADNSPQKNIGAVFAHNSVEGGETNGQLIFENCTFYMDNSQNDYGYACYINDANLTNGDGTGNAVDVKFVNCTLERKKGKHVNALRVDNASSISNLSGSITLNQISCGNNISQLNFPQLVWCDVTLTSPIENVAGCTPLRYCKDDNKVRIEGTIRGLTNGSINTLFTLPVGYRPKYSQFFNTISYNESSIQIGKILVYNNGNVTIEGTFNSIRTDICVEFYAEK